MGVSYFLNIFFLYPFGDATRLRHALHPKNDVNKGLQAPTPQTGLDYGLFNLPYLSVLSTIKLIQRTRNAKCGAY